MFGREAVVSKREELTIRVRELGEAVNALRLDLLKSELVFVAGVVRGAEESLLVVHATLADPNIPDGDL